MERDQVISIVRLTGIEKFIGERYNLVLCSFINFKPVERFKNESDVCEFRGLDDSTSKRVLNLLEPVQLRVRKIVVYRVTVVKFGVIIGGSDDTGGFRVW